MSKLADVEMSGIEFQIVNDSSEASAGIESLAASLRTLRNTLSGTEGRLTNAAAGIRAIKNAVNGMNTSNFESQLRRISSGLEALQAKTANLKLSSTIGNNLADIGAAVELFPENAQTKLAAIADGLRPLSELGRSNLTSFINQLGKLPALIESLDAADIDGFSAKMKRLADAIRPLADEMNKVAGGFSVLPPALIKSEGSDAVGGTTKATVTLDVDTDEAVGKTASFVSGAGSMLSDEIKGQKAELAELKQQFVDLYTAQHGAPSEQLTNTANKIKEVSGALRENENALKQAQDAANGYDETMKDAGSGAGSFKGKLKGLLSSLKRIAMSRLVRSVISAIGTALRDGANNAYQFSKALGGSLASAMDDVATDVQYLKNSLGALVANLAQVAEPLLSALTDGAVNLFNSFNQLFAKMSGASSWTKAVKVQTEYAEATEDAAKATNNLISGFDELNILSSTDTSSSTDYSLMFEEAKFDNSEVAATGIALTAIVALLTGSAIVKVIKNITTISKLVKKIGTAGTTILKSIGGILAAAAEFVLIKNIVQDIAEGTEGIGAGIAKIVVVAGLAEAALYAAFGPAGLVVGALVGLAAVIVGVDDAIQEMMEQMAEEAFYSGTGTKISDLAEEWGNLMQEIVDGYQPILDAKEKFDELKSSAGETAESLEMALSKIELFAEIDASQVEANLDLVIEQFQEFAGEVEDIMDQVYGNIVDALAGSIGATMLANGANLTEVLTMLGSIKQQGKEKLSSMVDEMNDLQAGLEAGTIGLDEYQTRVNALVQSMSEMAGLNTSAATDVFADLEGQIGNIDWEDDNKVSEFFESVTASTSEAKASVTEAWEAYREYWELMKSWTDDAEYLAYIDNQLEQSDIYMALEINEIDRQVAELFDALQEDIILKLGTLTDEAKAGFVDESGWWKFWHTNNEAQYVSWVWEEYLDGDFATATAAIQQAYKDLEIDGTVWAGDAADAAWTAYFQQFDKEHSGNVYGYLTDLDSAIDSAFEEIGVNGSESAAKAGTTVGTAFADATEDALLAQLKELQVEAALLVDVSTGPGGGGSGMSELLSGWNNKFVVSVAAFAGGGFPDQGQMFIANEAGPELVGNIGRRTAVVNNDQIMEGIEAGVYRGVREANSESGGNTDRPVNVSAKVNEKVLFEVFVNCLRSETVRLGYNPLLEY